MARKSLSDHGIAALKPRAARFAYPDPELAGHFVRVQPSGAKSFCAVARNPSRKQVWVTIGSTEMLPIAEARIRAREIIRRVRDGLPAIEPRGETFATVAKDWLARHVGKKGLRSAADIERLLNRYVLPPWRVREFVSIRRSDIATLLDHVEDNHGARQADVVLAIIRGLMNWWASRRDDYNPPIVRGMRRQSAQARARILGDDELSALWAAAETSGAFGAFVRVALLTGQRRNKVANMRWSDIEHGVWTIPAEPREKGNAGALALPDIARQIMDAQPRFDSNPFVFAAGRGHGQIIGFSKGKSRLDRASGVTGWTVHDLRRSARSLMSRAGVSSEHAERVMGHAQGIYDRHSYFDEKADALTRLAALIDGIVHPRSADVLPLAKRRRRE
jgi:integrase